MSSFLCRATSTVLTVIVAVTLTQAPAEAATVVGRWGMKATGDGRVYSSVGTSTLALSGEWQQVSGVVGGAVRFTAAPSTGVAPRTADVNPGVGDFAMSLVFTSRDIPDGKGYSGNLVQKGRFGSPGQIKLQLVPAYNGSVNCRVAGRKGSRVLSSRINVDDGRWHTASCWREGSRVGLTVDGSTTAVTFDPGTISNNMALRIGNKSKSASWTDQHFGANDCTVYLIGDNARTRAADLTPC